MATTPTDHVTQLARRIRVDIDVATFPTSDYQQLFGVEELKPVDELRTESDESYDDDGAMREVATGHAWRLEIKLLHRTAADGITFNPVHDFLHEMFLVRTTPDGEFGVRWYDRDGRTGAGTAHEGRAYVKSWAPDGGAPGARDTISLVIQGQGPLDEVSNPNADLTPTVTSLDPNTGAEAGGNLVTVRGSHYVGVTDVDFGATPATEFEVVDATRIVAIAPAGTGTVQVSVTTAEGTSADTAADNYTYA